jgi:hypothetical protein
MVNTGKPRAKMLLKCIFKWAKIINRSSTSVTLQSLQGPWPPHTRGFLTYSDTR